MRIHRSANVYGCEIGDDTTVGAFVEIQRGARIGSRCKISSHSFICDGVIIDDDVFIGHHVCFTNDKLPRATTLEGALAGPGDWVRLETHVASKASIGSGAVILPGVVIGQRALVGAGAVVTGDVAPGEVVYGNPARRGS